MLTANLESWIQKGKAEFKTFSFGGSGVGTIPVPTNHFIIITDFDYFYFSDVETESDFARRSVFQLSFRSQKSNNHFIIRNGITPVGEGVIITFFPYHKDCYLTHEGNVQIDIVNVPTTTGWAITTLPLPAKSNEAPQPVGYGIGGQPAVRRIDFSGTENYLPLTKLRDDIASGNFYREQFKVDVNAANKLNPPFTGSHLGNFSYPIVNVSYVLFNMNLNEFVQASN